MFVEIHEHPANTAGPAVKPVKPYSCISADDLVREGRDAAVKAVLQGDGERRGARSRKVRRPTPCALGTPGGPLFTGSGTWKHGLRASSLVLPRAVMVRARRGDESGGRPG